MERKANIMLVLCLTLTLCMISVIGPTGATGQSGGATPASEAQIVLEPKTVEMKAKSMKQINSGRRSHVLNL